MYILVSHEELSNVSLLEFYSGTTYKTWMKVDLSLLQLGKKNTKCRRCNWANSKTSSIHLRKHAIHSSIPRKWNAIISNVASNSFSYGNVGFFSSGAINDWHKVPDFFITMMEMPINGEPILFFLTIKRCMNTKLSTVEHLGYVYPDKYTDFKRCDQTLKKIVLMLLFLWFA